ncbi:MAG: NAD(P)-binding domain-containing protein [Planctomycetes bacterium]|nr:NAD(P)-binding domain-containing protein [Planctomycetota bacterium]
MDIHFVGIIGAGVMGSGLAQSLAQTGHEVCLIDNSQKALEKVSVQFEKGVRLGMMFDETLNVEHPTDLLQKVTFSDNYQILAGVDYVIETVTEKWEIKKAVFTILDDLCAPACVLASNTSAIPITKLGSITQRPDKVIGLHFMNPVQLKATVEMIRGERTSEETIEITKEMLTQMKKDWILVNDSPGFVSNRVLMLTLNEAIYLVQEEVASVNDIDQVFKSCLSYKMGPLETSDLIGLDTILLSLEVLRTNFKDDKYRPCPLLEKMVAEGNCGRKSGRGFYHYPELSPH